MSRVALIRVATYAIIVVCIIVAERRHYFIPLHLPPMVLDGDLFDPMNSEYRGGFSPTLLPGFADTVRRGSEVMRSAVSVLQAANVDLRAFRDPQITLQLSGEKLRWEVAWTKTETRYPSSDLVVYVDDQTGRAQMKQKAK